MRACGGVFSVHFAHRNFGIQYFRCLWHGDTTWEYNLAFVFLVSVHLPSRSRLLPLAEREICKKKICKTTMKGWSQRCYFHFFNADSTDHGLATHESAILTIDMVPRRRTPSRWAW